ncbi:MotA/TolQ/ExbB proton channel family protein [Ferrimonas senticii]|uniref:MotA/TolQ/ExbB proton channel family protein n=1 Tax=Ferrimonas senticii TaxID=394566 RepID=UPI0006854514|nr:MotA/TolQ/ExbB proton channel family protein [Ferrimonas senticii]
MKSCLIKSTIAAALLSLTASAAASSSSSSSLSQQADQRAAAIQADNHQWQQQLSAERQALLADSKALSNKLAEQTATMQALQAKLAELNQKRQQLSEAKAAAEADMALVDSSYRHALSQLQQRWQLSPSQYLYPQRQTWLVSQIASEGFPSSAALQQLVDYALGDLHSGASITPLQQPFASSDGRSQSTDLTVIGQAMVIGQQGAQLGLIDTQQQQWLSPLPSHIEQPLQQWQSGASELLPLDLSQGSALASLVAQRSWQDWVVDGGEMLWPILALTALGLLTIVICGARLLWWRPLPALNADQIEQQLSGLKRTPAATVLLQAWHSSSLEAADQQLKQGMLAQLGRFERGLAFVTLLAALAPMLGLLGTVSGMIETFRALTEFGNAEPKLLSSGISKALITTQAGLIAAIPLLLLHHPLKRRAQRLTANMEQHGAQLLAYKLEGATTVAPVQPATNSVANPTEHAA